MRRIWRDRHDLAVAGDGSRLVAAAAASAARRASASAATIAPMMNSSCVGGTDALPPTQPTT